MCPELLGLWPGNCKDEQDASTCSALSYQEHKGDKVKLIVQRVISETGKCNKENTSEYYKSGEGRER